MEKQALTVVWTDPAKYDLQSIYNYLAEIAILIAENQINRIVDKVEILEKGFDGIGQKEPLLANYPLYYRYLVQDIYKIIYHSHIKFVIIDMVFDTRQNPKMMAKKL